MSKWLYGRTPLVDRAGLRDKAPYGRIFPRRRPTPSKLIPGRLLETARRGSLVGDAERLLGDDGAHALARVGERERRRVAAELGEAALLAVHVVEGLGAALRDLQAKAVSVPVALHALLGNRKRADGKIGEHAEPQI